MIPISAIKPSTEMTVKNAIQKLGREAASINTAGNYGAPAEAVEGKFFPDPDNNLIYVYFGGNRYSITINLAP